jgi:hypothetical protein
MTILVDPPKTGAPVALRAWRARQWVFAATAAIVTFLLLGLPTAVIENPVFGRSIAPTAWALPVLAVTAVLAGLLAGTYVVPAGAQRPERLDRPGRIGSLGGAFAYLAIGCPVCNKVVLLALGTTGAVNVFAPVQPYLAAAGVVALGYAVRKRLLAASACETSSRGGVTGS